ncbi:hypothetical protein B0H13DRAFT_2383572 [Mycena leptocephala]|nr:hypothetical protein B0H13DRAFT_2383572 [Mycena leptocephala]
MPHSSSPTPSSSPQPLHDLLALTQQLTPSKSPRAVRRIRQQIQAQANEAQQEQANLKRRAVDAEHQVDTSRKPRKMRKRNDRARDADNSELNPQDTETRIRDAGRHFALTEAIFLIDDDIMDTVADTSFDFAKEFDSSKNERQGQLRDILAILPDDVRPKVNKRWVQDSFLDGLHNQRSSMGYRVRTEALQYIVDDVKLFATSASRFDAFSELIGYKPATKTSQAFYERFEVPLLYDKWDGTINVNGLFRGNAALEVYVSCIRGRQGANGLFDGKSKLPQAKCLERIHKITRTTPGAIILQAIWLHSADTQLVKVGDETTIDYGYRYRVYIRRIRQGLRDKKAWAIGLLQYWDRILFPTADKSREHDAAGNEELDDDDEELDDIFDQAPSAAERTNIPQPSTGQLRGRMAKPVTLPYPTPPCTSLLDKPTATAIELPVKIISSTIKSTAHQLPYAGNSSTCLGCEVPTCRYTRRCKRAVIPAGHSLEPRSNSERRRR